MSQVYAHGIPAACLWKTKTNHYQLVTMLAIPEAGLPVAIK